MFYDALNTVSHTVHDLVFIWNITDPLVVNPDIELPQLDIANNYTTDCTIEYSTGIFVLLSLNSRGHGTEKNFVKKIFHWNKFSLK